ncbi:MAG TPA: hypothetical protein VKM93_28400 [Terriglobia bacterium]|nr:hypothetical protein [Terriglobia bacterium]
MRGHPGWQRIDQTTTFHLDSRADQANTALMKFGVPVISIILAAALVLGVRTAAHPAANSPQSAEPPLRVSKEELETYSHARTLVDWTPREIKQAPSLYKLRPAQEGDRLPVILKNVGERAAAMIAEFRNIACDEKVYSEWTAGSPFATWREMGPNEVAHHFLYIIIPRPVGDPLMFKEYRTNPKGNPIDLGSLADLRLITTNFTGSWAYLTSSNQAESRFRYFGEESVRKQLCYVVGFAQKPDVVRNFTTFEAGKHSAVILVQGLAWIDERSFHIQKLETWLLAPRKDIGLESENTTVNYVPVLPAGLENALWLPNEVKVLVHYHDVFIRNTHHYSRFKLFQTHAVITP